MRFKKVIFSTIILLLFGLTEMQAQNTIPAAGGNIIGIGGSGSYTLGQILYTTNSNSNGSVAQGVQQPYEISVLTGLETASDISIQCNVYPNPTAGFLNLNVLNYDNKKLSYWLYDFNGNLLQNKKMEANECNVPMQTLLSGTYILKVTDNDKVIKTFKIIKN